MDLRDVAGLDVDVRQFAGRVQDGLVAYGVVAVELRTACDGRVEGSGLFRTRHRGNGRVDRERSVEVGHLAGVRGRKEAGMDNGSFLRSERDLPRFPECPRVWAVCDARDLI